MPPEGSLFEMLKSTSTALASQLIVPAKLPLSWNNLMLGIAF